MFFQTINFFNAKCNQLIVGKLKNSLKLRIGKLLIDYIITHRLPFKKCTFFANIPITIIAHRSLNSCIGIILETDLQYVPESGILKNLKEQSVTDVHRITIIRNKNKITTKHTILTINSPKLSQSIKWGHLKCFIRPYIQNFPRCFECQHFDTQKHHAEEPLLVAVAVQSDTILCIVIKNIIVETAKEIIHHVLEAVKIRERRKK